MLTFFLIKETTYVGSLNFTMSSVLRLVDHGVCGWVCGCVGGGGGLGRDAAMKRMQMKVRIKFLKKTNLGWLKLYLATRVRTTGKNNRFPLLDILGY